MRIKILGNSVAAAYLAVTAMERGHSVSWLCMEGEEREGLRPLRVPASIMKSLRSIFARRGGPIQQLLRAPELRAWQCVDDQHKDDLFFEPSKNNPDHWVDENFLFAALREIALQSGAETEKVRAWPVPSSALRSESWVVDLDPVKLAHWPKSFFKSHRQKRHESQIQLWLPNGRMESAHLFQFAFFEGAQFCLEPHPERGFVLTGFSHRSQNIEKALKKLSEQNSHELMPWRVLLMMNPNPTRRILTHALGPTGLELGCTFEIGTSLGRLPTFGNLHQAQGFDQVERLLNLWDRAGNRDLFALSRKWKEEERIRFAARYTRAVMSQAFLFSPRFRRSTLTVSSILPRSVRKIFQSPL